MFATPTEPQQNPTDSFKITVGTIHEIAEKIVFRTDKGITLSISANQSTNGGFNEANLRTYATNGASFLATFLQTDDPEKTCVKPVADLRLAP